MANKLKVEVGSVIYNVIVRVIRNQLDVPGDVPVMLVEFSTAREVMVPYSDGEFLRVETVDLSNFVVVHDNGLTSFHVLIRAAYSPAARVLVLGIQP